MVRGEERDDFAVDHARERSLFTFNPRGRLEQRG
jgi:hypothetical protein